MKIRNLPSILCCLLVLATQVPAQDRAEGSRSFPHLGVTVRVAKVLDPSTGATHVEATDQSGRPVDLAALEAREAALAGPRSKVHPLLREQLDDAVGPVKIGVWLRYDSDRLDRFRQECHDATAAGVDRDAAREMLRSRLALANGQVTDRGAEALGALGVAIDGSSTYAPLLFARATADEIARIADLAIVDTIYPSLDYEPEIDDAVATHRWDQVHRFGIRGDGVKVAVIEDDGVYEMHPALNVTGWYNATHNVGSHATAVAGILGADDGFYPGHARGVEILSGNANSWNDADLIGATDWAIGQGADVVNMSFGVSSTLMLVQLDRYVDYIVRYTTTTVCKSAGNRGNGDGHVTSPGLAWNVITVGNVDNQNNADWDDDVMRASSSYVDPISPHSDREKPEIAAVGTNITTTDTSGGFSPQGTGTSYAAPAIAGMAAALMQADPSLRFWPEPMKAIMMAAAGHNIEGSSRLSDKDGAGCINGLRAYRIVEKRSYSYGTLVPSSFSNNGYWTHDIYLRAGDLTRVVLTWDSNADATYTTDTLDADLDLAIYQGAGATSGTFVASSASWDNNYEIVEFCPPVTGWYTVRVNDFRFDGNSEYYGLAWSQHVDGRYTRLRPWLPDGGDTSGPVLGNDFFWIDPLDRVNPLSQFGIIPSLTANYGHVFSTCRLSYGDVDWLTNFALTPSNGVFYNFADYFDSTGAYYSARIAIPDLPILSGFPIYLTLFTIDAMAPSGVKEISELEKVVFEGHATDLPLSDDGTGAVNIGFSFPFFGTNYTQCWVNANGNITFTAGDGDFSESISEFLTGLPRIAPFWDDLNPALSGTVRVRHAGSTRLVVEWVDVPEFAAFGTENSCRVTLRDDGTITMEYRDCALLDAICGISAGNLATTPTEIDLNHGFTTANGAIFEEFTGTSDAFDLGIASSYRNRVTFTPVGSNTYRVTFEQQN